MVKKYCRQPLASSTPRKSLAQNYQPQELIPSSALLTALLNGNCQSFDDQENHLITRPKTRKRDLMFFAESLSSSSDDDDDQLGLTKQPGIKIKYTNLKKPIDLKKETLLNHHKIHRSEKEKRNKSAVGKICKSQTKKSSQIPIRKNVSAGCKTIFRTASKETQNPPQETDNAFMFEKLGNPTVLLKSSNDNSKQKQVNEVNDTQRCLETYFTPIKNKTKKKSKNAIADKISEDCKYNKTESYTQHLMCSANAILPMPNGDKTTNKLLSSCDVNNEMQIFNSPYQSITTANDGVKTSPKTQSKLIKNEVSIKKIKPKNKEVADEKFSSILNKKNSSHQLFSDSKEQELINTLDLTKEICCDSTKNCNVNSAVTLPLNTFNTKSECQFTSQKTESSIVNVKSKISEQEQGNKETNKELCSDQHKTNEKLNFFSPTDGIIPTQNSRQDSVTNESVLEEENNPLGAVTVCYRDCKGNLRKGSVFQNGVVVKKTILKNSNQTTQQTSAENKKNFSPNGEEVRSSETLGKSRKRGLTSNNKNKEYTARSNEVTSSSNARISDVFKSLNCLTNLSQFKPGCAVAECWSRKNFKCGMLQLKSNSNHTSKTNDQNRYFGGVVVKGSLKMIIGEEEMDLREGDMAFVPPLTVWSVSNIDVTDAMMYYWCGRFRT